jgi:flagellar motor switch protein FliG
MSNLSPTLRKAAVLIAALDDGTAEALLAQMEPEESAKVRRAMVALDEIPPDEQQQVLAEFMGRQRGENAASSSGDDVTLELDSATELQAATRAPDTPMNREPPAAERAPEPPLAFLQQIAPGPLADLLQHEHPQTVAVVVSHLTADHAAAVLERLGASVATDALERMACLGELSPDVAGDLAAELRKRLAGPYQTRAVNKGSLDHLAAVVGAIDERQRERIVHRLAQQNAPLAERLGLVAAAPSRVSRVESNVVAFRYRLASNRPPSPQPPASAAGTEQAAEIFTTLLAFDDLALLNEKDLRAVFAAADPQVALVALTGAEEGLLSRILRQLPSGEATVLRKRLEHPGPIRLRDIEEAQAKLAMIASRLAREESITLPASVRFAAAV